MVILFVYLFSGIFFSIIALLFPLHCRPNFRLAVLLAPSTLGKLPGVLGLVSVTPLPVVVGRRPRVFTLPASEINKPCLLGTQ